VCILQVCFSWGVSRGRVPYEYYVPHWHALHKCIHERASDIEALGVAKCLDLPRPVFAAYREFYITARLAGDSLTSLAKARFESQLVKTNRALVDYAG
jgi:hypothetical protein